MFEKSWRGETLDYVSINLQIPPLLLGCCGWLSHATMNLLHFSNFTRYTMHGRANQSKLAYWSRSRDTSNKPIYL